MDFSNFLNVNVIQNALGFIYNAKRLIVYRDDKEVLSGMSVLSYSVKDDSQFITHPIETGAVIADHHVFNPIQVTCSVAFPPKGFKWAQISLVDLLYGRGQSFEETFKELSLLYKTSAKLRIKTDADVYDNMYITSIPTDVSPDDADRQIFSITFEQAITVTPQYIKLPAGSVKNASNSSYTKTGEVLPETNRSLAKQAALKAIKLFTKD